MARARRILIGGLCALVAAGALLLSLPGSNGKVDKRQEARFLEEISFNEAKEHLGLRQRYMEGLVAQYPPPVEDLSMKYNGSVNYVPSNFFESGGMIMRTGFTLPPNSEGVILNMSLEVYGGAFLECNSESEFLSSLEDHEYAHMELSTGQIEISIDKSILPELNERVFDVNGDLAEHFQELYAFNNQISLFQERDLTPSYRRSITRTYNLIRQQVAQKPKTPLTEWLLTTFPER